jgi:L-ascorbate metabolism protein UlaG (beta-lactamase superfamily)
MIKPLLQDFDFLTDIKKAELEVDKLHLWWLGQSGYLILWRDRHLLLDPFLSDSLTEKYAGTDTPHVRMTERVVDPQQLDFIKHIFGYHQAT